MNKKEGFKQVRLTETIKKFTTYQPLKKRGKKTKMCDRKSKRSCYQQ